MEHKFRRYQAGPGARADNGRAKGIPGERGSSSILLIIIMATLFSIGMLAVATTYSNYMIAQKNASWNTLYNELDGHYQSRIYDLAKAKKEANSTADEYFRKGDQAKYTTDLIPSGVHRAISGYYGSNPDGLGDDALADFLGSRLSAHLTAVRMGVKSDFSSMLGKSDREMYEASKIRLKGKEGFDGDRRMNVVVAIFGDEARVVEYREVPGGFIYEEEMEFTDIEG